MREHQPSMTGEILSTGIRLTVTGCIPKERLSKVHTKEEQRQSAVSPLIHGGSMTCMAMYGNGVPTMPDLMANHVCCAVAVGTQQQGNVALRLVERVLHRDTTVTTVSASRAPSYHANDLHQSPKHEWSVRDENALIDRVRQT